MFLPLGTFAQLPNQMKAPTRFPISADRLGRVYGPTGERMRQLIHRFGYETVVDPEVLLIALQSRGIDSPLRVRLTDPEARREMAQQISEL